jgi:hypothetical protein
MSKKKTNPKKINDKNSFPDVLYKYVTLNSIESILNNSSLKITNPLTFNDPFDCNIPLMDVGNIDIKKLIKDEFSKVTGLSKNHPEVHKIINSSMDDFNKLRDGVLGDSREMISHWDTILSEFRVLSLTTEPDNILMWSHYAKDHTGIVLGFKSKSIIGKAEKVIYGEGNSLLNRFLEKMFRLLIRDAINENDTSTDDLANITIEIFSNYLFFKRQEWSYEKEYRLVLPSDDPTIKTTKTMDFIGFNIEDLHSITFGIATPEDEIDKITKIIQEKYEHTLIYKAYKEGWNLRI